MSKILNGIKYDMTPFDEWVISEALDKNITTVSIPSHLENYPVTMIKQRAFAGCKRLERVELGDNLDEICESAFMGCYNLEYVYASLAHQNKGIKIGFRAFENCKGLISFQAKISSIEENAFRNCVNLEKCNISADCKIINNYAFCDCISLEKVFIESNPTTPIYIHEDAFFGTRIFEFHCQRDIKFISDGYIHSKTIDEFLPEPTVIFCPDWSNLAVLSYLGKTIIIEEICK